MSEWTKDRINKVVLQYIRETLASNEMCRQMPRISSGVTQTLEGKTLLEASDMQAWLAERNIPVWLTDDRVCTKLGWIWPTGLTRTQIEVDSN